ncbi:uncharacterized protein [Rutidosis leptorrhynchoides]|uniref:uncharacterized protein n=1 Tax=Rutidosis leptorrhynchoides TaxID=125765 RepID=UPI003A99AFCB
MARDWATNNATSNFELRLIAKATNTRQYNAPNVAEVTALITSDFGQCTTARDIIVQKNSPPKRISELHQLYMALQYPLLFPYGEMGYHEEIPYHSNSGRRKTNRGYLTMREFYCYRIQQWENEGTTILRGGRLFQQYLVDAYTAVKEQRLKWLRNHQNELRIDLYNNMCDAVTRGDTRATAIGRQIILPSSHTGSPRYMVQSYQDAMALCREFDNPDLFITFTSNPKWLEIEGMLSYIEGQRAPDRPEIVARLFKQKLDAMMADIMKAHVFGTCEAGIYIIEFQKRGLPHVYMLIWLTLNFKCTTPEEIDDIISAEIPCETQVPTAYKAVTKYMLHGPCGGNILDAPCIIDKKCSKHFPKPYNAETTIDEDGYANYRRRNNGIKVNKGKGTLDNSFVMPYNRYLLLKYNAHINVEWCNQSRAIKYLFKYLNKGHDRATIVIQENLAPVNGSAAEMLFGECVSFDIHFSKPSVIKLSYHLPNHHTITLRDSDNLPALLHREIDGTLHPTFKDACFAYGLINDDRDRTEAITEARLWASGAQLRDLFVTILLFCNVTKPLNLWEANWEALAEDILYKKHRLYNFPDLILSESQLRNYCLLEIQGILNKNGKSLADFPDLPQPDPDLLTQLDNRLIREDCNTASRRPFFLISGGTEKTFVYKTILAKLRSEKLIALAVASSGIASLLLPGGRTAHSRFVIPLDLMENSTCGIKQKTHLAGLMQQVRLIIWDEAPMTQRFAFEALDKTLKDILGAKNEVNRGKLFGGLPILLGGDFRQILPVIPKGKRQEVVQACINRSDLWQHCQLHTLSRIMRVNEYTADGQVDPRK